MAFSSVNAASLTYSFITDTSSTYSSKTFDLGGGLTVSISATAGIADGLRNAQVVQSANGLGIDDGEGDAENLQIDGDVYESLDLLFNRDVTLTGLLFGSGQMDDQFDLAVRNTKVITDGETGSDWVSLGSDGFRDRRFSIVASELDDDFYIQQIRWAGRPIPEPGTLALLSIGLLAFSGRFRQGDTNAG